MTLKSFFKRVGYCLIIGFLYSLTSMILNPIFKKPVDVLSSPIILQYYNNPRTGLNLVVPSFDVIIPLEFARAMVYLFTITPMIALLRRKGKTIFFTFMVFLYIVGGLTSLIEAPDWPIELRIAHGVELFCDFALWGLIISRVIRG